MKPRKHSIISAKKYGGRWEEYQKFHDWMDQSKVAHADVKHRAILHHSLGIFIGEQVFGPVFINSEGRTLDVRDILEQHVMDDLGWIPSPSDYFKSMEIQDWFGGMRKTTRRVPLTLKSTTGPTWEPNDDKEY